MIPSSYKPIQESESPSRSPDNSTNQQSVYQRLFNKIHEIDKGFVVSKLFYFFFYTALGALFPFFSLYYKQLWLTPSQIGILLALRPTVKLICLPLWKMVTDKYSKPKAVYFISIFGWLIGYFGQTLVYTSDIPCYSLNHTQSISTFMPNVNSSNSSSPLNGSPLSKRQWIWEKDRAFNSEPYLNEQKIRRSINEEINFDEFVNSVGKINRKKREKRLVDPSGWSHSNGQATPRNDLHIDGRILRSNNMENLANVGSRKLGGKDFRMKEENEDQQSQRESHVAPMKANANLAKEYDVYKHSVSEGSEIDSSGLNNKDRIQDYISDNLDENRKTYLQKLSPDEFVMNDEASGKHIIVVQLDSSAQHLGAFQQGKISKSPKPPEDFRVRYNYWILRTLIVIVILTEIITSPTPMIADSAVIQSLAGSNSDYGRQRLFGFFGLGMAAILVAVWVSYSSFCHYTDTINYIPCFYIFIIAIGATVFVSLFLDFKTHEPNGNESKLLETLKIFKSPRYGFFLFTILMTGFAHSLQIAFLFWFLQDIGGTPTLFAIIILIHSVSEVVMYFLAGYLNQGVGHQGTLCIALACYTARFLMYGSLQKPWLIIPMEMVQGLTYGGVWSVSAVYIQAPEEATKMVQSILHGVYWGIGMAAGALISGFIIEAYGVQQEFLVMSLLMCILCVLHLFILLCDRMKEMEENIQRKRDSGLDKLQPGKQDSENFIGAAAAPLVPCLLYGK